MNYPGYSACIYTGLTGAYEDISVPSWKSDRFDQICFTDNIIKPSSTWRQIRFNTSLPFDPIRSQRFVKAMPHRMQHLVDYDISLYIDNSVHLKNNIESLIDDFANSDDVIWLVRHSKRLTLYEEFLAVLKSNLDQRDRVLEHFLSYYTISANLLQLPLFWGGMILRKHNNPNCVAFGEEWYINILRYSRRDQLSLAGIANKYRAFIKELDYNNNESHYHSWPHTISRNNSKRIYRYDSLPLVWPYDLCIPNPAMRSRVDNNLLQALIPLYAASHCRSDNMLSNIQNSTRFISEMWFKATDIMCKHFRRPHI
jgi:hypothetical protein